MVMAGQDQVHLGSDDLVEELLTHRTAVLPSDRDAVRMSPDDDPRDPLISRIVHDILDPLRMG